MGDAQEVARGLVVARGNGAVLLEPRKEVLDQVTGLVQVAVIGALVLAHTSLFRPGPRFALSVVVPLCRPTSDTALLVCKQPMRGSGRSTSPAMHW